MEQKQWFSGDKFIGAFEKAKQSLVVIIVVDTSGEPHSSSVQGIVLNSNGGQRSQYDFTYLETKLILKPLAAM